MKKLNPFRYRKVKRKNFKNYSLKAAKGLRGGFQVPNTAKTVAMGSLQRMVAAAAMDAIKGKTESSRLSGASRFLTKLQGQVNLGVNIGGTRYSQITAPSTSVGSPDKPVMLTKRTSMTKSGLKTFSGRKIKTAITLGRRTSSAVLQAKKLYGSYTQVGYDSSVMNHSIVIPDTKRPADVERQGQKLQTGFNMKTWALFDSDITPNTTATRREFAKLGFAVNTSPKDQKLMVKGMLLNARTYFKMSNSNSFFPVRAKLFLIGHKEAGFTESSAMMSELAGTVLGTQFVGCMPVRYQFSTAEEKPDYTSVEVSNKASMMLAPDFRKNFEILSTASVKLAPNDVWTVTIDEFFGGGVDVALNERQVDGQALSYSLALEIRGVDCEAVQFENASTPSTFSTMNEFTDIGTYIGTSPAEVAWELKHQYSYVLNPDIGFRTAGGGGGVDERPAAKTYFYQDLPSQEFHRTLSLIGSPGEEGKELFIPVATDQDINYARPIDQQPDRTATSSILRDIRTMLAPIALDEEPEEDELADGDIEL